jgi:hypothetical protein
MPNRRIDLRHITRISEASTTREPPTLPPEIKQQQGGRKGLW